ncbi:hypothetical protein ENUP19_0248G0037 [Entamoeba nuttalli]|uniref:Uncharacterized protein n=2 Tax=Entamoeba nuttalli TaxID=412467 RepID=K2GDP4_ENTNP|nr:hypothetical protein ENU1_084530 [Entamoeba nuttalli P19]EKE40641.1 hypothetical protein ENU1_084530 [Entamoeba nuttalli P19]|eukprot:XP_008857022.1 hypothetical protein ENU1_084530 [Entamoeba nuttalli P19]
MSIDLPLTSTEDSYESSIEGILYNPTPTKTDSTGISEEYALHGWGNDSSSTDFLLYDSQGSSFFDEVILPQEENTNNDHINKDQNSLVQSLDSKNVQEEKVLKDTEEWVNTKQLTDKRKDKLARITGRRNSLEKLSPFLYANSPEEAKRNAKMVFSSDVLKQKLGERALPGDISCINSESIKGARVAHGTNKPPKEKMEKITKVLGRRESIGSIADLLTAKTESDAIENGLKIRKMEKLKKMAGL